MSILENKFNFAGSFVMKNKTFVISLLLGFVCVTVNFADTPKDETKNRITIPDEITKKLESVTQDLNTISLVWKRERSSTMDFETLIKKVKCLYDYGFLEPVNTVYMWQNTHFYSYHATKNTIKSDQEELPYAYEVKAKNLELYYSPIERSFDGVSFYNGNGSESTEDIPTTSGIGIYTPEQAAKYFVNISAFAPEYLTYCGYKFPSDGKDLGIPQKSLVLFLKEHGNLVGFKEHTGDNPQTCNVLISVPDTKLGKNVIYEFVLLPKFNYAIKKCELKTPEGNIICTIENDNFNQVEKKRVFLPQDIKVIYYSFVTIPGVISDTPLFFENYRLIEVSTDKINKQQFDLRKKYSNPGTHVGDRTLKDTPEGVQYVVPANPADLDRVIESALTGKDFTPTPLPSRAAMVVRWILVLLGLAMIIYAGYRKFIKKKK
ncbi:MAG: hypothetical protein LBC74_08095 [Planctomycetaceae bacterium]|jgi:hypothetical protein|nr:hypothetical protein [Planctomycetaceae bacterium]